MQKPSDLFQVLTPEYQLEKPWWKVSKSYFDEHSLTEHQIESYNIFMQEKLPTIITSSELEYTKDYTNFVINFDNVYVKKPEWTEPSGIVRKLMPQDCRIRNLSYNCRVYTDITRYSLDVENKIIETKTFPNVYIGAMPSMVLSNWCNLYGKTPEKIIKNNECPQDRGGYFIVNGSERVLMSQDRMAHNEIFVFECKSKDTIKIPVPGTDKNRSLPCAWSAEVRSYSPICEPNITTTYVKLSAQQLDKGEDQRLYVETTGLKAPVPWPIVFMALGVTSTDEMISYVTSESDTEMVKLLQPSLDCYPITTQESALEYLADFVAIGQKEQSMQNLKKILNEKLFQNVSQIHMKRCYLGHMTFQLLSTVLDRRKQDDRDHYGKKRVETAGNLINNLFKSVWKRVLREVKSHLEKKRSSDLAQVFYSRFTNYIRQPFATGNWTATKGTGKAAKAGISQILNRHNYVSTISNLRRVVTPNDKNSKIVKPRHLHASQWMKMCSAETPEGQTTGLIKNMSMMTCISTGSSEEQIIDWLEMRNNLATTVANLANFKPSEIQDKTKIFVNGTWVGITDYPQDLVENLRELRRQGKIMYQTSISLTKEGLRVYTDEGRVLTPFFIVRDGKISDIPEKFSWKDLVDGGIVEYLDPSEMETLYIADEPWHLNSDHTHSVIHPTFMLGISASTNPFSDHTQAPRVCYQSAMSKQALGVFSNNFLQRYDTSAHILCYPQVPIVDTKTMGMVGSHELPSGQNLIVAVMSAAYNQEDSVVINKRAIDNGALRSINYATYSESCRRKGNTIDEIKKPEKNVKETRLTGYEKLDVDGIAKEGTPLCKRDIVISKVTQTPTITKDISEVIKTNGMEENSVIESFVDGDPEKKMYAVYDGSAVVDQSLLTVNEDSFRTVKVRVRQMRVPQIGDKVASRSAQKGIIGMIIPPENMIFSKATGMSPDLVMNPNAFPSRMTISQTLETILSKACTLKGQYGDCTPFEPEFKWGLEEHKEESLVDGMTGRKIIAEELKKWGFDECGDEVMINGMTGEEMPCKIFMGPTFYQRLKHMVCEKIHCLKEGTEVLTTTGWKVIEEITIEDKVAVLKNGMLTYENPEEVHSYPNYNGPMYYVKNQGIDLAVTGNHRMWVSKLYGRKREWTEFGFERADEIVGKMRRYKKDAEWKKLDYQFVLPAIDKKINHITTIDIPEKQVDMNAWLTFVGIWIAEGWTSGRETSGHVDFAVNKQRVKDVLFPALDKLGYNYTYDNSAEKLRIFDNQLYSYMKPFSVGAPNKKLPDWVFELSVAQTQLLIYSMQLGDGSFLKNDCSVYYTSSKELADQFQRLCLHAGWACIISIHNEKGTSCGKINGREIVNQHDILRCSVIKTRVNPTVNHRHTSKVQEETLVEEESCPVYCLTVSSGVFYVRRNGKACWTGNSRNQDGPRETLTRQPVEGRKRGGGFRCGEMEVWAIVSHGASMFMLDRLVNNSDGYEMFVCDHCGNIAVATLRTNNYECKLCQQNTAISKIRIPYAFKLIMQELQATGIGIWFKVDTQKTLLPATTPSH